MSDNKEHFLIRGIVIAAVASIAVLPLTLYGCGPEWARWDATQANMYFQQGKTEEALYQLRDAIRKSPRDPVLKLTLAERMIEIDKPDEALELADEVLKVFPDNKKASDVISLAFCHKGDFKAALNSKLEFGADLNLLAYFRGLANTDLHLAKEDIEDVLHQQNQYISWPGDDELNLDVKATVLAAMVARCCDSSEHAIATISPQIEILRTQIRDAKLQLTKHVYQLTQDAFPVRPNNGLLGRQRKLNIFERRAAALLSCRALLHQDLGDLKQCDSDRREVDILGFNSGEIISNLPDERLALAILDSTGAFLDTRGFINSLLPWKDDLDPIRSVEQHRFSSYENAVRDLNIAILCSEVRRKSLDYSVGNAVELGEDNRQLAGKRRKRSSAVLLYHRQTLYQRAGKDDLALQDEKRIRELGFEPGPSLY